MSSSWATTPTRHGSAGGNNTQQRSHGGGTPITPRPLTAASPSTSYTYSPLPRSSMAALNAATNNGHAYHISGSGGSPRMTPTRWATTHHFDGDMARFREKFLASPLSSTVTMDQSNLTDDEITMIATASVKSNRRSARVPSVVSTQDMLADPESSITPSSLPALITPNNTREVESSTTAIVSASTSSMSPRPPSSSSSRLVLCRRCGVIVPPATHDTIIAGGAATTTPKTMQPRLSRYRSIRPSSFTLWVLILTRKNRVLCSDCRAKRENDSKQHNPLPPPSR
jgi:hypothetical protein